MNCRIPKPSIRPLVKNSIVHSFEHKPGICQLKIQIWEEESKIHTCVENKGIGIEQSAKRRRGERHTGIGTSNPEKSIKRPFRHKKLEDSVRAAESKPLKL